MGKSATELWTVVQAVKAEGEPGTVSDKLVEMAVLPDYQSYQVGFASAYVATEVTDKVLEEKEAEVKSWWTSTTHVALAGPLRGVFYEEFAHRRLQAGGRFEYRELGTTVESLMELGPNTLREFDGIGEVAFFADGDYARPRQRNFPAVDALLKPNMLLQMTISTSHTINGEGLDQAMRVVGGTAPALYFVVPPSIYAEFREQPIKWTGKIRSGGLEGVPQFVMKVAI